MFSYVTMEQRIPVDHPIRKIRAITDRALQRMEAVLASLYAKRGRPSIAPERLLRAQLLMVLFSIRSESQLMEQLNFNLLYRWFVGLEMDDAVWETSVFSKNRERLIAAEVSEQLLLAVVEEARGHGLLSEEHFTVDGTLIQAGPTGAASGRSRCRPIAAAARGAASCCAIRMSGPPTRRRGCIARALRARWCQAIWAI